MISPNGGGLHGSPQNFFKFFGKALIKYQLVGMNSPVLVLTKPSERAHEVDSEMVMTLPENPGARFAPNPVV